ncbi:heavy-metal-associated domain-containing protein [Flagellimonas crocea]|uniref:heavy-metal-associated domain-containing protein n=1 Tax=Flagellimonas crocea TaxID=3067311 RepID=UPI00296F3C46|nr:heavy-metal-associated domain-containing protein [Muricauda sp. DH64]
MKTTMFTFLALFTMVLVHGQDKNKSIDFEVRGNCGMCKSRIEKAAIKLKGVKFASWSPETKIFEAIIDERKIAVPDIQKRIAEVGHDSEGFTAPDKVYDGLPECCKYRDPKTAHMDHNKMK